MTRAVHRPALLGASAALALLVTALPAGARAAPLGVTLSSREGRIQAAIDLGPAIPADLTSRLGNGLRNVLAIFVGIVPEGAAEPSVARASVLEILFDVWEESWSVTVRDARSPGGRRRVVATVEELRRLLSSSVDADLGPVAALPQGPFTVEVRIDVNPVSPELLARTREYLAGAAGRPGGASRSVLGTVAGLMLREPDDDGEVLFFRSVPLERASVRAR